MATAAQVKTLQGKFVEGSTMRHVINMTATGSIGLIAVFLVDVLNLLYISQLGRHELAAAIGYASTLLFFHTSVSIGLSIAVTATVSRAIGSGDFPLARQFAASSMYLIAGISLIMVVLNVSSTRFAITSTWSAGRNCSTRWALLSSRFTLDSPTRFRYGTQCFATFRR